jgi:hypothetical protein
MKWIYEKNNENVILALDNIVSELSIPYNGENFIKPKINLKTLQLYESATAEEIAEIEYKKGKEIYLKIYEVVNNLTTSALARATNKNGVNLSRLELENLKNEYKEVYEVAKSYIDESIIIDSLIFETLEFEQKNDFKGEKLYNTANYYNIPTEGKSRIDIYCRLIILKYESGEFLLKSYNSYIRTFRSKMITFLQQGEMTKVETGFTLVDSITSETTNEEILLKFNEFNLL